MHEPTPLVLVIGGHDPSGAGIQADIEACLALGCHAASVVTTLTAQNTRGVRSLAPVDPAFIAAQANAVIDDFRRFDACKIGLLGAASAVEPLLRVLERLPPDVPVIVDPVLAAGAGGELAAADVAAAILERLAPRATLLTPNLNEGRRLTGEQERDDVARRLCSAGARHVLLTGADEPTRIVHNYLYRDGELVNAYEWPRLPGHYHGSGCTLASSIAAYCAKGHTLDEAVSAAQSYTWRTLACAIDVGGAQRIPGRRPQETEGDDD
ncbi:MAG: hydroxymethylpyrimidine/phosphomethylpyrimidine kinase [Gammaproteobacteria bacterium]|nr:hydroxymethylpyrimidine/phosphomethylpyrimidine kinase [Gammaproteobacteria bacterium]